MHTWTCSVRSTLIRHIQKRNTESWNLKLLRWSLLPHLQCTGHINWKLTTAGTDMHSMSGHVIIKRIRKAARKDWASKEMKCCIWIKLSHIDEHFYRQLVISCYRNKHRLMNVGSCLQLLPTANPVVTETIKQSSHYRHVSLVFRHYLSLKVTAGPRHVLLLILFYFFLNILFLAFTTKDSEEWWERMGSERVRHAAKGHGSESKLGQPFSA